MLLVGAAGVSYTCLGSLSIFQGNIRSPFVVFVIVTVVVVVVVIVNIPSRTSRKTNNNNYLHS